MMSKTDLIEKINLQIIDLTNHIENEISLLNHCDDESEKLKHQKYLIDNLHKITHTLFQVNKLEKSYTEDLEESPEKDQMILAEYLKRINW